MRKTGLLLISQLLTKIEPKANECWGEDTWVIDPEHVKDQLNEEKGFIQDLILKKSLPVRTRVALGLGTKEDTDILASLGTYLEDVLGTEVVGSSYTLPQMPAFLTV